MSTCRLSNPPAQRGMFFEEVDFFWQLLSFTHSNVIPNLYDFFVFHKTKNMFRRMFALLFSIQNKKTKKVGYFHYILIYYNLYGVFFVILKPSPQSPFTLMQKEHEHPAKYLLLWNNKVKQVWNYMRVKKIWYIYFLNNDSFNVINYILSEPKLCNLTVWRDTCLEWLFLSLLHERNQAMNCLRV